LENLLSALYKTVSQIYKQKELHQSRLELLASNEQTNALLDMQDRFIKDALHEINTPLAVIMTTLELLNDKCANNQLLDRIDAASRTLKASFEDLIYHTINGQAQIKVEAIDLVEFIEQRIEYFKPIINANALKVEINLANEKLPILINPVKLQRLIDNTISNAIKYSYRNPGIITANLSNTKLQYIFSIKNFGPKIEDTESIFNRFYRESTQAKGYGLGLGIVKQICEEENIDVKVDSSAKGGTTFTYKFKIMGE
jgi:signal transduction histidine kinase